ncbi:MAG: hypothetical protein NT075_21550 [Chloroflexi bacterium]|nr:hypothetical protein [Chloroflexota bacterium]
MDIANEMEAIYTWFMHQLWFTAPNQHEAQLYFEPANEPNNEWYPNYDKKTGQQIDIAPNLPSSASWSQMDAYFSNLYDTAHAKQSHLQILAPPMGQRKYAEPMFLGKCGFMAVDGVNGQSGYDFMPKTYNSDRFEGYSWHNYWAYGTEQLDFNMDVNYCFNHSDYISTSQHLFQYLPRWMIDHLIQRKKPVFMTEADVMSPCQEDLHNVMTMANSKFIRSAETQLSLHDFIVNESFANYVIVWLLVQEDDGTDPNCINGDANYEIAWHEAYYEQTTGVVVRDWFRDWWMGDEN